MEFVRKLLEQIVSEEINKIFFYDVESDKKYIYHLKILKDAGFIDYKTIHVDGGPLQIRDEIILTNLGNDLYDSIINDTVWGNVKIFLKEKGIDIANTSFQTIIAIGKMKANELLGINF